MTDAELLRSFIDSRDDLAFGRIVARHAAGVRRIAMLETGNAAAAEDVTQATFIVLSRRPGPALRSAKRKTTAEAWLHQVARYASGNWRRAENRRRRREKTAAVPDRTSAPDPSQPTDLAEAVAAALRTLRRRDRRLILLRHVEEKPWSEEAAAVNMGPEAARKATDRASDRLRLALQDQGIVAAPSALVAGLHVIGGATTTSASATVPFLTTGISVTELAKGTITMMNLKSAASVSMLAAGLVLGGAGAIVVAQDGAPASVGQAVSTKQSGALVARLSDGTTVRLQGVSDGSGFWWEPDGSNPVERSSAFLDQHVQVERQMAERSRRIGHPELPERPRVGLEFELATNRDALGDVQIFSDGASSATIPTNRAAGECHLILELSDGVDTTVEFAVPVGEPIAEADVQLYGLEHQQCELAGTRVGLAPLYRTRLGNDDVTGTSVIYAGDLTGRAIHAAIILDDESRLLGSVTSRSRAGDVHVLNFYFSHDEIPQPARGRLVLSLVPLEMVRFSGFATQQGETANAKVEVLSHEEYVNLLKAQTCPVPGEQASGNESAAQ